jgi:glc operon protein GlcG
MPRPIILPVLSAIAVAAFVSGHSARAVELPTRPMLTLEAARTVAAAAEAKAKSEGWPCVISVVDDAGLPILLERMNDAAVLAGVELAPGKARTAALFRRESGALEDAINGKRPAAITARGFVLMRGGVPLVANGRIVGAIGVSADTPDHDEEIAKAGAAALGR